MSILRQKRPDCQLYAAAIHYATRGWSIIPTIGKKSSGSWKRFQAAPADEPTLRRMFGRQGTTGLAVILGTASGGLACRDFDDAGVYQRWAAEHEDLARTLPTVQTARGYHVYFHGPEGYRGLGDGEYRADAGHYCLLPPSRHPSGTLYRWVIPLPDSALPIVDPVQVGLVTEPQDLKELLLSHPHHTHCMCQQVKPPITSAIADTLPTAPGQRNRRIFDLARRLKAEIPDADAGGLEPVVREWFRLALPVVRTKEWSETWADFKVAWQAVKNPLGGNFWEILHASKTLNVEVGNWHGAAAALIRLAASLQKHHGPGKSWPLSCELAGKGAGISKQRASSLLRMLTAKGVIERVTPAGPKGSRRAATYRFLEDVS